MDMKHKKGFHYQKKRNKRDDELVKQYRLIGIKAIVAATLALRKKEANSIFHRNGQ